MGQNGPVMFLSSPQLNPAAPAGWRRRWFDIIFGHEPGLPRRFDLLLIVAILVSVLVVLLDSVAAIHARWSSWLLAAEWAFTLFFTAEYAVRLWVVRKPLRYALSSWGVIDLLSILPTYISLVLPGGQALMVVRILRILRVFRILKLTQYLAEGNLLVTAMLRSRRKIFLFVSTLVTIVVIFGALMYLIEGPQHGFTSIPTSMYWAVVTMGTVGYGDISPETTLGRLVTSVLILIGYSIIAVPTGIYTAELANTLRDSTNEPRHDHRGCPACGLEGHERDARYCRGCAGPLPAPME
jgi:voltage-gated potassium channel